MLADITFYGFVLFVHIAAVVLAFGVTFAYPLIFTMAARENEAVLPFLHSMQHKIGQRLIAPFGGVALLAGIYLAAKGPYDFSDFFVTFGLVVLVALLIMGGVFFGPNEAKAQALAERDLAAGGSLSDEYRAAAGKIAKVGAASGVAILLATLFMATHLGA